MTTAKILASTLGLALALGCVPAAGQSVPRWEDEETNLAATAVREWVRSYPRTGAIQLVADRLVFVSRYGFGNASEPDQWGQRLPDLLAAVGVRPDFAVGACRSDPNQCTATPPSAVVGVTVPRVVGDTAWVGLEVHSRTGDRQQYVGGGTWVVLLARAASAWLPVEVREVAVF